MQWERFDALVGGKGRILGPLGVLETATTATTATQIQKKNEKEIRIVQK